MKKTFITLLALAGVAMGETVSLDTKYTTSEGTTGSFYEDVQSGTPVVSYDAKSSANTSKLTFYVSVSDLFGTTEGLTYNLNSLAFIGHEQGFYSGGGRYVTVSNGEQSITGTLPTVSNGNFSATFEGDFIFAADDILTVTIDSTVDSENVCIMLWDTTKVEDNTTTTPCPVTGAAWSMSNGELVYENADGRVYKSTNWSGDHDGDGKWVRNDIALRLNATVAAASAPDSNIPEPATATLSLLALAGLCARRRRA